ncbi:hypothetical protein ACFO5Q_13120 [Kordiimonas lipolytica]|uniref:Uncharacterized protein n=1 Tax=Kordiimonas lipolytica TaxID=1662421 RepID=A0ABV8UC63_9PROT|nr:hypothetical protein [Kordiimonas lipolytica]
MRLLVGALLLLLGAVSARAESDIELLNATLVAKFHFAEEAPDGQMVGAYQVSFRNIGDTPVSKISLLLNPGLQFDKVVGPGGKTLKLTSRVASATGMRPLELNVAEVTLPKSLRKGESRLEIVVHYRGYLQDLSQTGLVGVKETLHPDFTMIRAQSFGYPVFADADRLSIQEAWTHKPFYQVAFLDVPGLNSVVGNLKIAQKTTDGDITKFEMKSEQPTGLMTLAIGPYKFMPQPAASLAYMTMDQSSAAAVAVSLEREISSLSNILGPLPNSKHLTIAEIPDGFKHPRDTGLALLTLDQINVPDLAQKTGRVHPIEDNTDDIFQANGVTGHLSEGFVRSNLIDLWRLNPRGKQDHWAVGIDRYLQIRLNEEVALPHLRKGAYRSVREFASKDPMFSKTPLTEYAVEGFDSKINTVSTLTFNVLDELLGRDEFFALVRSMRADLSVGYADMQSVADHLDMHIKDKKARKFANNWFQKGRIGKDMAKAGSFEELVALYR